MKRVLATIMLVSIGVAASAQTAPPLTADSVIAARQAGYDQVNTEAVFLKQVVDQGLDPKPFAEGIKALESWGKAIPAMFPDGTQTGHNTKARPEVWTDRAGFEKAAENFTAAATKLSEVAATGDKDAFKAQYAVLGGTCGACHRAYRAR